MWSLYLPYSKLASSSTGAVSEKVDLRETVWYDIVGD